MYYLDVDLHHANGGQRGQVVRYLVTQYKEPQLHLSVLDSVSISNWNEWVFQIGCQFGDRLEFKMRLPIGKPTEMAKLEARLTFCEVGFLSNWMSNWS